MLIMYVRLNIFPNWSPRKREGGAIIWAGAIIGTNTVCTQVTRRVQTLPLQINHFAAKKLCTGIEEKY